MSHRNIIESRIREPVLIRLQITTTSNERKQVQIFFFAFKKSGGVSPMLV